MSNKMLKETIKVNNLLLRNRVVMPPMATGKAVNGAPDDSLISYYEERSTATALIILEHEYVSDEGMAKNGQLSMASDDVIMQYKKLTKAVHKHGALIFAQLNHAGARATDTGKSTISASNISIWKDIKPPFEMNKDDIDRVRQCFVNAALRAKEAGFDGVEIHSAHAYLLNQFYSPLTNKRTDEYNGKTLDGRTRLQCEIIKDIRKAVGENYPIAIRLGAHDYIEGGSPKEDIAEACRKFEESGADLIDITGGMNGFIIEGNNNPGWFSDLSRLAKTEVSIPVIVTGGIKTPKEAEEILQRGDADLIGIGRAMIQNPKWAENM